MRHKEPGRAFGQQSQGSDGVELFFVLGVWAVFSIAGFLLIARYGTNIPKRDDCGWIALVASNPLSSIVWHQIEFRCPAWVSAVWGLWHFSPGDLRLSMLIGFSVLSLECLALVFVARWARGRSVYSDSFFPLVLLHLGHAVNFLWWEQAYSVATFGALALIISLFSLRTWHRRSWTVVCATVVIVLFSLSAFSPKLASPVLAVALLLVGISQFRDRDQTASGRAIVAMIGGAAVLVGFISTIMGVKASVGVSEVPVSRTGVHAAEFLAMSFGPIAKRAWPLSGALAVFTVITTALLLIGQIKRSREDRLRAGLLLLSLGAWCFVALAIAYARGRQGALLNRYALYSAPFLCVPYLAWSVFPVWRWKRIVPFCLFALMLASSSYHFSEGHRVAKQDKAQEKAFLKDVAAGIPLTGIVARHQSYWGLNEADFRRGLRALRAAEIMPFAQIRSDPSVEEWPLPLIPSARYHIACRDGAWKGEGRSARLVFSLDKPRFVYALRFKYVLRNNRGSTRFKVSWVRADSEDLFERVTGEEMLVNFNTAKERRQEVQTIWIDDTIAAVSISPSEGPFEFRLDELTALVKPRQEGDLGESHGNSP